MPRVHNCSKLFQSWSWSQEKKEQPFTNAIAKFKAQTFPKRTRLLIKSLFKNSFSTNFQGTGPWEIRFTLVSLFSGVTIAANFFRADPGFKRRKVGLFHKQLPHSKSKPFPRESDRLLNPYWRTVLPQISKALGHERVQFTLVGLCPGVTIAANFSRADPGAKRRKKLIKPLFKTERGVVSAKKTKFWRYIALILWMVSCFLRSQQPVWVGRIIWYTKQPMSAVCCLTRTTKSSNPNCAIV